MRTCLLPVTIYGHLWPTEYYMTGEAALITNHRGFSSVFTNPRPTGTVCLSFSHQLPSSRQHLFLTEICVATQNQLVSTSFSTLPCRAMKKQQT
jgi:hypothetical protein